MIIRDEHTEDADILHQLTYDAFKPMTFSNDSEADCLRQLRADGDLFVSLVAELNDEIIGHAAFSPAHIGAEAGRWFGLGPISVRIDHQRQGVGRALIAKGLERLRASGAAGCVLLGNPDVYRSSGFRSDGQLTYGDLPTKLVQHVCFSGASPVGEVTFAPGLAATD
ncbi:MAG: N-acetyltransferase [Paracoccaceae bacterium]